MTFGRPRLPADTAADAERQAQPRTPAAAGERGPRSPDGKKTMPANCFEPFIQSRRNCPARTAGDAGPARGTGRWDGLQYRMSAEATTRDSFGPPWLSPPGRAASRCEATKAGARSPSPRRILLQGARRCLRAFRGSGKRRWGVHCRIAEGRVRDLCGDSKRYSGACAGSRSSGAGDRGRRATEFS